ncbi:glycosyltransferase family 4 protein [candidate division KSB1 bacterium]|nr:glycosyltransferase family 4 protein [candidate division KSB1 bacterium]
MKVFVSSLYFYPEKIGIAKYSYEFAKYLVSQGHEVHVFTTTPFYPQWKRYAGYRAKLYQRETVDNIIVHRIYTYIPAKVTSLTRILHEFVFSFLLFFVFLMRAKPDVLFCVSPPFFSMVVSAIIKKLKKMPLMLHIQDLQPDSAADLGMLNNSRLLQVLYRLEKFSYDTADLISTLSESMRERIVRKNISPSKCFIFKNWVDFEKLEKGLEPHRYHKLKRKLGLNGEFVVLYSGNIGVKQGVDTLIETAELSQMAGDDIHYLIVGNGAKQRDIRYQSEKKQLSNVSFLDVLPESDYFSVLSQVDICLVMQKKQVVDIVVPSKLLDILAAGTPVIATVNRESEAGKILKRIPFDVIGEPEEPRALYEKILSFKQNYNTLYQLRHEQRQLAQQLFDQNFILPPVVGRMKSLVRSA